MLQAQGYVAYTCDRCHRHLLTPLGNQVSCTVLHSADDCCHYGELHIDWDSALESETGEP